MNVYKVKYKEHWTYQGKGEWDFDERTIAAKDGEEAIAKVKAAAMKQSFEDEDDDGNPTGKTHKCTGFQLRELELVTELDM